MSSGRVGRRWSPTRGRCHRGPAPTCTRLAGGRKVCGVRGAEAKTARPPQLNSPKSPHPFTPPRPALHSARDPDPPSLPPTARRQQPPLHPKPRSSRPTPGARRPARKAPPSPRPLAPAPANGKLREAGRRACREGSRANRKASRAKGAGRRGLVTLGSV